VELIWTADQRRLPEFMPRAPVMVGEAFVAPKVFYGFWVAVAFVLLVLAVFRYWRGRGGPARHGIGPGRGLRDGHQRVRGCFRCRGRQRARLPRCRE